mgnify:CR=1 FL=1
MLDDEMNPDDPDLDGLDLDGLDLDDLDGLDLAGLDLDGLGLGLGDLDDDQFLNDDELEAVGELARLDDGLDDWKRASQ